MYRLNVIDTKKGRVITTAHYTNLIVAEKKAIEIEGCIPDVRVTIWICKDKNSPSETLVRGEESR